MKKKLLIVVFALGFSSGVNAQILSEPVKPIKTTSTASNKATAHWYPEDVYFTFTDVTFVATSVSWTYEMDRPEIDIVYQEIKKRLEDKNIEKASKFSFKNKKGDVISVHFLTALNPVQVAFSHEVKVALTVGNPTGIHTSAGTPLKIKQINELFDKHP